jgi:two-component system response regulator HydG
LRTLEAIERDHVIRTLAATKGNREEASRILGISRRTLIRMIQRWHLQPHQR